MIGETTISLALGKLLISNCFSYSNDSVSSALQLPDNSRDR